mgnify:CR=1 FL=1
MHRYGGSPAFDAAMHESPYSQYDSGEDGMFEENVMFPVALYSEMLWDADKDYDRLVESVAFRNYVTFA